MSSAIAALHVNNVGKELFPSPGFLQDGDVVEFIGEQSTGKSSLLQSLMITCLLPKAHGGCGCGVIYFDLDCHFDLLRILSIVEAKTGASESEIKLWVKNLHVIRCDSTEQLVITLHSIEPLIANSTIPFGMIILDSISSFYWIDAKQGGDSLYRKEINLKKTVQVLKELKERYRLCIVSSTQQLVQVDPCHQEDKVVHKPFLCRQWQDFVKHRYILCKRDSKNPHYVAHYIGRKTFSIKYFINEYGINFMKESS